MGYGKNTNVIQLPAKRLDGDKPDSIDLIYARELRDSPDFSPLFNGGAESGESEIRRWLLENDMVEAIVAMPTEIFFRTGIGTYLWILSNKKEGTPREGKVQLINATGFWTPIKNEGNKRRVISEEQQREIVGIYADFEDTEHSRVLDYRTFGYSTVPNTGS